MKAKSIEPLVVSAIEAAEMLRTGVHVVYPLIERGEIPAYRVGCNWKVPITKLQQYVEERAEAEAYERRMAMKPKTAVFIIAIFGILVVVAAYVKRGEFGIGPEWALPVIAAAIVPLKEGGRKCQKKN